VRDRIGTSPPFDNFTATDRAALQQLGVSNYLSLGEVRYLTNPFETRTQGIDVVGSYALRTDGMGTFNTTLAFNWNDTQVGDREPHVIGRARSTRN
jgi:iron complex outermembrane receptor protein